MSFFYGDVKSDELKTANGLQLQGGTNNNFTLTLDTHPSFTTNYNLNFPAAIGDVNQYLKINDLNGNTANLGFADVTTSVTLSNINIGTSTSNLETSAGNININDTSSNAILTVDTLNKNLVIPDNSKLYFGNTSSTANIYGSSGSLYFKTYEWGNVNVNAYGFYVNTDFIGLYNDTTINGNIAMGKYGNSLTIKDDNSDIKIHNEQNEKDTIFYSTYNFSQLETMRFVGANNTVRVAGTLALMDGTNSVKLQAHPSTGSTYTLNFPTALGTQNQVLEITSVNGTTANLGFTDVSGGGLSNVYLSNIEPGDSLSNLTTTSGSITLYAQNDIVNINALTSVNVLTTQQSTTTSTGSLIISGGVGIDKNLNVGGNLAVTDTASFASTLSVTGTSTLTDDVSASSNVDVSGNVSVTKSLYVTENTDITGTLNADGATTLGSTLGITGALTTSSTANIGGNSNITGTLDITGATTLGSTLGITGALTTSSTANIGGNSNITGTLDITGATTIYDNLTINGDLNTSNTFSLDQGSITVSATGTEVLDFSQRSDFIISVSGTSTLTLASKNVNTVGQQGSIIITQTADTNSLSWQTSNGWYFPSATAPTLSVGTGIYDVFSYLVVEVGGSKKILVMDATNFQAY